MVESPGVAAPLSEAETLRHKLRESGQLRGDLEPLRDEARVVFPTNTGSKLYEFKERKARPDDYAELLSPEVQAVAPRAFEAIGDIGIIKIPDAAWAKRQLIGEALQSFLHARAIFHDHGVKGEYRVRDLELIAGQGNSATMVRENGVNLNVDVGAAYFSPRLASERSRISSLVQPGERLVDLFGGVAPQGVQAAKAGAIVTSIDLNPAAHALAKLNAQENGIDLELHCGDARVVAGKVAPSDRLIMNLPHGASEFLDVAITITKPGAVVHYHEIILDAELTTRQRAIEDALVGSISAQRVVRDYSKDSRHWVFDVIRQ